MDFINRHRCLVFTGITLAVLVGAGLLVRPWLGGYAVRTVLTLAGASEIRFQNVQATPWHVTVEQLEFRLNSQILSAQRLILQRSHWWMLSLGDVKVEGAKIAYTIDGSDVDPWSWQSYQGGRESIEPASLPVESLSLAGKIVVSAANLPDQHLAIKLEGAPKGGSSWVGSLVVQGEGFNFAGAGTLLNWGAALDFQVHSAELDLAVWQAYIQRRVLLPDGPWQMGGKLTGVAEGHVTAKRFAATARINLRAGHMRARTRDISAEGAEVDLEFSDLWKFRTKSGELRLAELRLGRLPLRKVTADFGFFGEQTLTINSVAFDLLGGRGELDSFRYFLNQRELATTLKVDSIDLVQLLPITTESDAPLTGRIDGMLPLRIQETGVRIDSGYLSLQPTSRGALEINVTSLLRSGALVTPASLGVLKEAATGTVRLRLQKLRLDIRPPGLPLGCSALLHVSGDSPHGPVAFDFNVNGAIEKYLSVLPTRR